jgi:hypothetical protein
MIPKSSGWSALVQFAGYRTPLTFRRKCVSLGCAAQLSTKSIIFLFCAPIRVSNEWRNEQNISVVIHVLLFAWYLIGNFLMSLKHVGFEDFPITIATCLSLQSLVTLQHGGTSGAHVAETSRRGGTSSARALHAFTNSTISRQRMDQM